MAPYQMMETARRRLRQIRLEQNLKQGELAERCGLARSYISKLERGLYGGQLFTWLCVAEALGVTLADLMRPDEGSNDVEEKANH